MLDWLKRLLGKAETDEQDGVKNFDAATADLNEKQYQRLGSRSIPTDKIVGSVGRAHELDENFRYRKRDDTGRYQYISEAIRQGKPADPIKVLRVKRQRQDSEYYVLDGHHRVAEAKKQNYREMNADVTDVVTPDNETSDNETPDNATHA